MSATAHRCSIGCSAMPADHRNHHQHPSNARFFLDSDRYLRYTTDSRLRSQIDFPMIRFHVPGIEKDASAIQSLFTGCIVSQAKSHAPASACRPCVSGFHDRRSMTDRFCAAPIPNELISMSNVTDNLHRCTEELRIFVFFCSTFPSQRVLVCRNCRLPYIPMLCRCWTVA